ncbi:MAG: precorrin-6A reductase [Cloacibacillus sp.]
MTRRLLLFGGTTEARELTRYGLPVIYCAASDYGAELVRGAPGVEVKTGRMDAAEMERFMKENEVACVIDATHPYAREASENIKHAANAAGLPLLRVRRNETPAPDDAVRVKSAAEAAAFIEGERGNVLITTGSKEIEAFASVTDRKRLFARVLPDALVIQKCAECGFDAGHLIAMQGPFSLRMNEEMLRLSGARWLVTKDGGAAGGTEEKLAAAANCGARVVLIERPHETEGASAARALLWARRHLGVSRPPLFPMLTDIEGRRAVVVGGGAIAARRAKTLRRCGASVYVISPDFCSEIKELGCTLIKKKFEPSDLDGAVLVAAATNDAEVNKTAADEARRRGIPVSAANDAALCSFYFPSLVNVGEVSASVSAGALSPALTHRLAGRLRAVWESWVSEERLELEKTDEQKDKNSGGLCDE